MSGEDSHHQVPKHPIAPRLKDGPKTPHIDHHDSYKCVARFARSPASCVSLAHVAHRKFHNESLGHESDKWWAKVRLFLMYSRRCDHPRR